MMSPMTKLRVFLLSALLVLASLMPVFASSQRVSVVKEYPGETVTFEYEDGYLVEEVSEKGGSKTRTVYTYMDGRLAMCISHDEASNESSTVFFLRSPSSYELVAVRRNDGYTYIEDSYLIQNGMLIESSYILNEDGTASILDSGVRYEYSADGTLVREIHDDKVVEYVYDGFILVERRTSAANGSYEVEHIHDGEVSYIDGFGLNGEMEWRIVPGIDGKGDVKTIYDAGRPIANVHYKEDNVRVDRIEYL